MRDKRMTLDDVVDELESGMTIGIGGWGSRRKPMALIRAILRSDLADLTIVTYGGPDLGRFTAVRKAGRSPPPWTVNVDPLIYDASGEARKAAAAPTSDGCAIRRSGTVSATAATPAASP